MEEAREGGRAKSVEYGCGLINGASCKSGNTEGFPNRFWDQWRCEIWTPLLEGEDESQAGRNDFSELMAQESDLDLGFGVMGQHEFSADEMNAMFPGPASNGPGCGVHGGRVIAVVACATHVWSVSVPVGAGNVASGIGWRNQVTCQLSVSMTPSWRNVSGWHP